jgi:signal peptidase I
MAVNAVGNRCVRIIILAALGPAVLGFFYRPVIVVGDSMSPTLRNRQVVLTPRFGNNVGAVSRGDIVVFQYRGEVCVKRVVGLAGDILRIARFDNGSSCFLGDGLPADKVLRYARLRPDKARVDTVKVPEGTVYVAGDNRPCSLDSRDFGPVPLETLMGRVETPVQAVRNAVAGAGSLLRLVV